MTLHFPSSFSFGTSTSACQIETALDHDWRGIVAGDGAVFERTTDHELRVEDDVRIISSLAPNYRCSLMWSRLQRYPYAPFESEAVQHYHSLLRSLRKKKVSIMLVLHHWCNPTWFNAMGGWEGRESVSLFTDFAIRLVDEFGQYVTWWNTFNEPNLYATFAYGLGEFPPFARDVFKSVTVIRNMASAHSVVCGHIKEKFPRSLVGLSINCVFFSSDNIAGTIPARMADYWYMEYLPGFFSVSDFIGVSYYARLSFDPFPVSYLRSPEKFANGRPHDDIWEYYPDGLYEVVNRFWTRFRKPIIITENGICTSDDDKRIKSIKDYMRVVHRLLNDGVPLMGYFHWTTWDNFEWTLGPSYQFGLYGCNPVTRERTKKKSAQLYSRLAFEKKINV